MKRRKNGGIIGFIGTVIMLGILIAVLRQFNFDIIAAGIFILEWIWDLIVRIADVFTEMPGFRQIFR